MIELARRVGAFLFVAGVFWFFVLLALGLVNAALAAGLVATIGFGTAVVTTTPRRGSE